MSKSNTPSDNEGEHLPAKDGLAEDDTKPVAGAVSPAQNPKAFLILFLLCFLLPLCCCGSCSLLMRPVDKPVQVESK